MSDHHRLGMVRGEPRAHSPHGLPKPERHTAEERIQAYTLRKGFVIHRGIPPHCRRATRECGCAPHCSSAASSLNLTPGDTHPSRERATSRSPTAGRTMSAARSPKRGAIIQQGDQGAGT